MHIFYCGEGRVKVTVMPGDVQAVLSYFSSPESQSHCFFLNFFKENKQTTGY